MRLYLVRHGESYSNTGGTVMSYTDMPLTDKGREQARLAGEYICPKLRTDVPLYAFCSDLMRTQQTGEEFMRALPAVPEMTVTADITEFHQGVLEGMTWADRMAKYPHLQTDVKLSEVAIPGGESFQNVKARCRHFADEYLAKLEPNATVLIFSHGLAMRVLVNVLLNRPDEDVNRLNWFENTAVTEIEYCAEKGCGELLRLNDYTHLKELGTADYGEWGVFCREPY